MAVEEVQQPVEVPKFDPVKFMADRNAKPAVPGMPQAKADEPTKPAVKIEAKAEAPATADKDEDDDAHPSRSNARRERRLREQIGYEKGRREALEDLMRQGFTPKQAQAEVAKVAPDGEPTRDQFTTDAEYYKAVAKFEVRAEMAKGQQSAAQESEQREFMAGVSKATEKFNEDVAQFPDWADVVEAMHDVPIDAKKQETFVALVAKSDQRAAILYHLAKNPADREMLFAMSPSAQIAYFHRLEGRMEAKYLKSEAAQASGTPGKTASTPEKPAQGAQTAAERDVRKPKPSAEVAARGGSAPPETPAIGSAAWLAMRNRQQFGK